MIWPFTRLQTAGDAPAAGVIDGLMAKRSEVGEWRNPPGNVWAFQHVDAFLPTATIANNPSTTRQLTSAPQSMEIFRLSLPNGTTLSWDQFLEATATDGLVILRNGVVAVEAYANGMTAHTPHILMSASKSITGLVCGILAGAGRLDMDTPVGHVLPDLAGTAYRDATPRLLLDMRSGVVLDARQRAAYDAASNWDPPNPDAQRADLRAFYRSLEGAALPTGGPFRYVSANTDLLGLVLEAVTGQTVAALISTLLWQPMGAEAAAFITLDDKNAARCTGGICATVRDLARVGQLIVDGGERGRHPVVPASWLDDMATQGDAQAWKDGEFARGFGAVSMRYRSGWYVIDGPPTILFAMGIHGQNLFVDRANQIVIAKLSHQGSHAAPIDYAAVGLTHAALPEITRCLLARA